MLTRQTLRTPGRRYDFNQGERLQLDLSDRAVVASVLGRQPRLLDLARLSPIVGAGKFLVTGAGGSVGREICRQLKGLGAHRIDAVDHSDHALIELLARLPSDGVVREHLCNVRDGDRLAQIMRATQPTTVVHAAALKHVHMGDRHPAESILTNLVAVRTAFEAALDAGAETFVLVSSDKAAAPTSVMGVCKRLAELYLEGRRRELRASGRGMRVLSVRFGNVFGSQGSVAEIFARQIAAGEALTITHRDMARYFMTIEEAVQLILLVACEKPENEDSGGVYLLDMGRPVRILDIAQRMMAHAGVDLPIVTCGAREGEKIDEELYDEYELVSHSGLHGVLCVRADAAVRCVEAEAIAELERLARSATDEEVRRRAFAVVAACLGEDRRAAA